MGMAPFKITRIYERAARKLAAHEELKYYL